MFYVFFLLANDGLIGSRNKLMEEKSSEYGIRKKTQAKKLRCAHNQVKAARPMNTKKGSKVVSDDKSGPK